MMTATVTRGATSDAANYHDWGNRIHGIHECTQSLILANGADLNTKPQLPEGAEEHIWSVSEDSPSDGLSESQSKDNVDEM